MCQCEIFDFYSHQCWHPASRLCEQDVITPDWPDNQYNLHSVIMILEYFKRHGLNHELLKYFTCFECADCWPAWAHWHRKLSPHTAIDNWLMTWIHFTVGLIGPGTHTHTHTHTPRPAPTSDVLMKLTNEEKHSEHVLVVPWAFIHYIWYTSVLQASQTNSQFSCLLLKSKCLSNCRPWQRCRTCCCCFFLYLTSTNQIETEAWNSLGSVKASLWAPTSNKTHWI